MARTNGRGKRGIAITLKSTPLITKLEACHNRYLRITIIKLKKLFSEAFTTYAAFTVLIEAEIVREKRKIHKEKLDVKRASQHRLIFDDAIQLYTSSDGSSDEDELP
ncbi:hypothetical protein MKX01_019363 [Papaver californicum]|nr:hypothetical protein MKX01_019363 [Papaver californicum]